jgi:hypothetical protein
VLERKCYVEILNHILIHALSLKFQKLAALASATTIFRSSAEIENHRSIKQTQAIIEMSAVGRKTAKLEAYHLQLCAGEAKSLQKSAELAKL